MSPGMALPGMASLNAVCLGTYPAREPVSSPGD